MRQRKRFKHKKNFAVQPALAVGLLLGGFTFFAIAAGGGNFRTAPRLLKQIDQLAVQAGFGLKTISLTGFDETSDDKIFAALKLESSQTLLTFDGNLARDRLEALPWVHAVRIKQIFPHRLDVTIHERQAYALWINPDERDRKILIDRSGRQIDVVDGDKKRNLPVIQGYGARQTVQDLFKQLARYPELNPLKLDAVRIADRRWNLTLADSRKVLLPEKNYDRALERLMAGDKGKRLFDRDFAVLDLRVADQVVLRLRHQTHISKVNSRSMYYQRSHRG